MSRSQADLTARIAHLERKLRIAMIAAVIGSAMGVLAVFGSVGQRALAATAAEPGAQVKDVLRVRELDVVDKNGITRVKLASPLPVAKHHKTRGGSPEDTLSGMLLFDADGEERSGYATADRGYSNVLLTLDGKQARDGKHRQHALFIGEPTGATTLRLFNADTQDRVDVAVNKDGPSISMVRRGKQIYRQPVK